MEVVNAVFYLNLFRPNCNVRINEFNRQNQLIYFTTIFEEFYTENGTTPNYFYPHEHKFVVHVIIQMLKKFSLLHTN